MTRGEYAEIAIARTPLPLPIMIIVECASHTLTIGSDTGASDRTSAADTFLVPMTTTSLPTTIVAPTTMTTRIRSLSTRVG